LRTHGLAFTHYKRRGTFFVPLNGSFFGTVFIAARSMSEQGYQRRQSSLSSAEPTLPVLPVTRIVIFLSFLLIASETAGQRPAVSIE